MVHPPGGVSREFNIEPSGTSERMSWISRSLAKAVNIIRAVLELSRQEWPANMAETICPAPRQS